MASVLSTSLLLLGALCCAASSVGCAASQDDNVTTDEGTSESAVETAPSLVIADSAAASAAVVFPDRIELPASLSVRYPAMPKGTIFVSPRGGAATGEATPKNPDGFLRRVESARTEGGTVIIMTSNATLTDAIVNGSIRASSSGRSGSTIDSDELNGGRDVGAIDIDFADQAAWDNVDEIDNGDGTITHVSESVKLAKAHLVARPAVEVDLRIQGGKVSRFVAKVEGQLDSSILAHATVTTDSPLSPNGSQTLLAKHHQVEKVIYKSKRIPLPTFSVGKVPVSTAVEFTVALKCDLAFGGPLSAKAGVDAKSTVRLAAVQTAGEWAPPTKSDFDIKPTFTIESGSEATAHCAIEANAELSAYGMNGIVMSVAPYVDFGIERGAPVATVTGQSDSYRAGVLSWTAGAGATGTMRGEVRPGGDDKKGNVFGIPAIERPLASWKSGEQLRGAVP